MKQHISAASDIQARLTTRTQLGRLFALRNYCNAGVVAAVLFARYTFDITLPFTAVAYTLAAIALINVLTWWRLRHAWPVTDQELFFQLCLDVVGLGLLLYLSGGSTNPFVSLLLFPLILAVTLLPPRYSWSMAVLTVLCYTLLFYWFIPLADQSQSPTGAAGHDHLASNFRLHIVGMWFNFVISAGLIAIVAVRMMESIRSRDHLLVVAREETLRNERIIAVGSMAAGAAHELGTPLSTIAIICKEMQHEYSTEPNIVKDLQVMQTQVDQCKRILSALRANAADQPTTNGEKMPLDKHLERILDKWLLVRPYVKLVTKIEAPETSLIPEVIIDPSIDQALMNLFNNAADASPDHVEVELAWSEKQATITIGDRGPGLSEEALRHVGKAFFTSKSPSHGFGIGLYLANASIERWGGEVSWFNREGGGAITQVTLPLSKLNSEST